MKIFFCGLELLNEDTRSDRHTDRQTVMAKVGCGTLKVVTEKVLKVNIKQNQHDATCIVLVLFKIDT
jgi:hypothetical protein